MSFERVIAGAGIGAEPAPSLGAAQLALTPGPSSSLQLQILSAEHWSLLASRSLAWNESFSRAGMFLSTLSGAIVALALVAQASAFGDGFTLFALVILPIVLFIGVTTSIRLGYSNYHEAICVIGMNRIRAAYMELAPGLERYFVTSAHDDFRGIGISRGEPSGGNAVSLVQLLVATPMLITVLNSVLAGVIGGLAALRVGAVASAGLIVGVCGFVLVLALQLWYARTAIERGKAGYRPLFPTPEGE